MPFKQRFLNGLYRWLPIIMGCHCREDRSFHYHGRPFPVCARCTGMLLGFGLALILCFFVRIPLGWLLIFLLPGFLDGMIQRFTAYESRNLRRLWTGFFLGLGGLTLLIDSFRYTYSWGARVGQQISTWIS